MLMERCGRIHKRLLKIHVLSHWMPGRVYLTDRNKDLGKEEKMVF